MGAQTAGGRSRGSFGPGALLGIVRGAPAWTRAELAKASGLGRTAVAERLDLLHRASLITVNEPVLTGGRPAETYSFNADVGRLMVADIGGRHTRIGIADLDGRLVASAEADLDADEGPGPVLGYVIERMRELIHEIGLEEWRIRGLGVGVPGPVAGGIMQRPHLPGWEGADVPAAFGEAFPGVPVVVDKDANILARGEQARDPRRCRNAIVLKVGMGVSCAVIVDGAVLHGAHGAAGDIGHVPRGGEILCRCGQYGCLDAVASGRAIAAELAEQGRRARTSREIVDLVRGNDSGAIRLVREAGRQLGGPLGFLAAVANPSVIIVGGNLAESPEPLLAGIRETVYGSYPPSLTSTIDIVASTLGAEAGLAGAAQLALDTVLLPENVDATLS
jgi:predicted NBD/HSP70 family sugar kinase